MCGHRPDTSDDEFREALCFMHSKTYHRPQFTVGGCWNKSLYLQPLQQCYYQDSGSPASACVMGRHYSCSDYASVLLAFSPRAPQGLHPLLLSIPITWCPCYPSLTSRSEPCCEVTHCRSRTNLCTFIRGGCLFSVRLTCEFCLILGISDFVCRVFCPVYCDEILKVSLCIFHRVGRIVGSTRRVTWSVWE